MRDLDAEVKKWVPTVGKSSNQAGCKHWQKLWGQSLHVCVRPSQSCEFRKAYTKWNTIDSALPLLSNSCESEGAWGHIPACVPENLRHVPSGNAKVKVVAEICYLNSDRRSQWQQISCKSPNKAMISLLQSSHTTLLLGFPSVEELLWVHCTMHFIPAKSYKTNFTDEKNTDSGKLSHKPGIT